MDPKKLQELIKDHSLFLKSDGREGKKADLSNADLRNAELTDTNLSHADLSGCNLNNANLSDADLSYAVLTGANLISAELVEANLSNADLTNAILRGANLISADLTNAVLINADLTNANLTSADLISADLSNAELTNADLTYSNLSNSILRSASLRNADLIGANLIHSNLSDADLQSADLTDADLSTADLCNADLCNANMSYADLSNADFSDADMSSTDLSNAVLLASVFRNTIMDSVKVDEKTIFGATIFANIDLSSIKNLQSAIHLYPSTLGIDTIVKSNGLIDRIFLRNAGVQLNIVTYIDSFVYQPIDNQSCFINYSKGDESFARKLHADLQARKIRCWIAPEDIKIGDKIGAALHKNIMVYDKLLLILSEDSVKSGWAEKEVTNVLSKNEKVNSPALFTIRLDNSIYNQDKNWIEAIKEDGHICNFTEWQNPVDYKKSFDKLLRDLKLTDVK